MSKKSILISLAIVAAVGGGVAWWILSKPALPPGFAGGNGRLEAKQVDISTKYAGRIKEVLANEGDTVDAGQVVATMDTEPLEAQLRAGRGQDSRGSGQSEYRARRRDRQAVRNLLLPTSNTSAPKISSSVVR